MDLDESRLLVPRLEWVPATGSTNSDLVAAATGPEALSWPDLSVLATDDQTEGRGRLGRQWQAPAGASLAVSVLLRPAAPLETESIGWLPLLAGAAMALAVQRQGLPAGGGSAVSVKWPNDVLVGGRKVSGILSEAFGDGFVIGAGVNLFLTEEQLPVPTATSLVLEGVTGVTIDRMLSAYLLEFGTLYTAFVRAGGDAVASGVAEVVTALCGTLGREVRVELPGGESVLGAASALDGGGRLVIERGSGLPALVVSAGDVTHLRH